MSDFDIKALFKSVVRQIHPDLFESYPFERTRNSESLKKLNGYVDSLSRNEENEETNLEFFVKRDEESFTRITVVLDRRGSLAPLFLSFGLITPEDADIMDLNDNGSSDLDFNLFEWLKEVISEATNASKRYEELKRRNADLRMQIEMGYGIDSVDIGGENYITTSIQERHFQCLTSFEEFMRSRYPNPESNPFQGLSLRLYHPDTVPLVSTGIEDDDGIFRMRNIPMKSHVSDNGVIHLVAQHTEMETALESLKLDKASILRKVEEYWVKRSRDLAIALSQIFGVENVWYNSLSTSELQAFVLWAGEVLQYCNSKEFRAKSTFMFNIMVESVSVGHASIFLDHVPSSRILTVRTDCPPEYLMNFFLSQEALEANRLSSSTADEDKAEAAALQAACDALGARRVVRICASYEKGKVFEAAKRLIKIGPLIKTRLDLSSVSVAIDDRYDVWDSGIISIPYDFKVADIEPNLKALLTSGKERNEFATSNSYVLPPTQMNCIRPSISLHKKRSNCFFLNGRIASTRSLLIQRNGRCINNLTL